MYHHTNAVHRNRIKLDVEVIMSVRKCFELETEISENGDISSSRGSAYRESKHNDSSPSTTKDMLSNSELCHTEEEYESLHRRVKELEMELKEKRRLKITNEKLKNSFMSVLHRLSSMLRYALSRVWLLQRYLDNFEIFGYLQKAYISFHSVLCGYLFVTNLCVAIWHGSNFSNLLASMIFACWHVYIAVFLQKDGRPNLWESEIIRLVVIWILDSTLGVSYMSDYVPMFGHCIFISFVFSAWVMVENRDKKKLYEAIKRGDIDYLRSSFQSGTFQADERLYFRRSLLHLASFYGQAEIADYLIEKGAQLDALDMDEATPLYLAADRGHAEVVSLLIEQGAEVNHKQDTGMTALHVAAHNGHSNVVMCMVEEGTCVDLNAVENDGWTALHYAAKKGHCEVVKILIGGGATVDCKQNGGCTPLYLAVNNGHRDTARLLVQADADVNIANSDGNTPLLLSLRDKRSPEICKMLLGANADVNVKNRLEWTPLHLAAKTGNYQAVSLLLKAGAAVDATKMDGWTPLHLAARNGRLNVVEELIKHHADVSLKTTGGKTALELAKGAKLAMNKDKRKLIINILSKKNK